MHDVPAAHPELQLEPPQSTPASSPFMVPSEQLALWQSVSKQTVEEQSLLVEQTWPSPHFSHRPPQSVSVSSPSNVLLIQLGAMHVPPSVHSPESQSEPARHIRPGAHPARQPPPQSASVSFPLNTASVQFGIWQKPPAQTPEVQSVAAAHVAALPHF